jgi:hypothetical protein
MPVFDIIRVEPSTGGVIAIPQESVQTSSEEAFRRLTFNGTEIVFVSGRNLGSGAKVFTGTNGSSDLILDFKSVRGGLGIAIEEDANHITITATGETAPFFPAVDEGVYTAPVITFDDQGRITSVVNGIAGGSTTASNLGGVGSIPVFVQKTGPRSQIQIAARIRHHHTLVVRDRDSDRRECRDIGCRNRHRPDHGHG